jgi:predicted amino acid racemase
MFLEPLIRRNPDLIHAAISLHQVGIVPANSYVLDLDCIEENARLLSEEGKRLGLRVFAMTKQIGRNPAAINAIRDGGIDAGVAVDMDCARAINHAGLKVGHVGHLVQVPRGEAYAAVRLAPSYWTVFSDQKASEAAAAASTAGDQVQLLARVHAPNDRFYPGHEGGFEADSIRAVADRLESLDGASFGGVTTFPALLYDASAHAVRPTPNLNTVARSAETLRGAGYPDVEVNAPGTTSVETLSMLADAGATQVEPGHALTGTTPLHAVTDLPERPAMLYLTEVSHVHAGRSYCFGGGLYVDPVFDPYPINALVGHDVDEALGSRVLAELPPPSSIDYYGQLEEPAAIGASVVFGFRAQAFVTRANVVALRGVGDGRPTAEGVWTAAGHLSEAPIG